MRQLNQTLIKIDGEYLFLVQDEKKNDYYEYKVPQNNRILIKCLDQENDNNTLKNNNYFRKFIKVDSNQTANVYYYFEYKPNTISLCRFIDQMRIKKTKSEQFILNIIYQMVEALQILHSQGLMGRVFNTQNILINENDNKITLMNFGFGSQMIAKQQDQQSKSEDDTSSLLPFTLNNDVNQNSHLDQFYDEKLDIWLLGCVLYHLMTHDEFKQSQIQQNIKQNEESMIQKYNSNSYSQELRDLLRDMLIIQQLDRINFYDLVNNQLFSKHPKIQQLKDYYRTFYKSYMNDKKQIYENIESDYASLFNETQYLRTIYLMTQYKNSQQVNDQDIFIFKLFLAENDINFRQKLQINNLITNLQVQNKVYLLKDHTLIDTMIFILRKLFIYQLRKIIITFLEENSQLYADWQKIYDQHYKPFLTFYQDTDLNDFYYSQNLEKQFEDNGDQICLTVLAQLQEEYESLNGINFRKYYQLLSTNQIDLFQ